VFSFVGQAIEIESHECAKGEGWHVICVTLCIASESSSSVYKEYTWKKFSHIRHRARCDFDGLRVSHFCNAISKVEG
jgi:hypothetical protein